MISSTLQAYLSAALFQPKDPTGATTPNTKSQSCPTNQTKPCVLPPPSNPRQDPRRDEVPGHPRTSEAEGRVVCWSNKQGSHQQPARDFSQAGAVTNHFLLGNFPPRPLLPEKWSGAAPPCASATNTHKAAANPGHVHQVGSPLLPGTSPDRGSRSDARGKASGDYRTAAADTLLPGSSPDSGLRQECQPQVAVHAGRKSPHRFSVCTHRVKPRPRNKSSVSPHHVVQTPKCDP